MTDLRIGLLNTAKKPARPWRNFRREIDAELVEYQVRVGDLPPPPERLDVHGIVVTGSPASVYADEPWIQQTRRWVAEAVESGVPHLGVCFGHQLLAAALGGTVEPMQETEIGYRTIRHYGDLLFSGIEDEFRAFTSHSDTVTELPEGAHRIAENDFGVQGFRDGHAFGIQFHAEYDPRTAREITQRKDLPPERIRSVLHSINQPTYRHRLPATRVFDNFLSYVASTLSLEAQAPARLKQPTDGPNRDDDVGQTRSGSRGPASRPSTTSDGEPR